ncbi:E3 SUMO-protein ligase pli1 [Savitreella phatthalungensis]
MSTAGFDRAKAERWISGRLLVANLRDVLREEGLPSSGNKPQLVTRVAELMSNLYAQGDSARYERLRNKVSSIRPPGRVTSSTAPQQHYTPHTYSTTPAATSASTNPYAAQAAAATAARSHIPQPVHVASRTGPYSSSTTASSAWHTPATSGSTGGRFNKRIPVNIKALKVRENPFIEVREPQSAIFWVKNDQPRQAGGEINLTPGAMNLLTSQKDSYRLYLFSGDGYRQERGQDVLMHWPDQAVIYVNGKLYDGSLRPKLRKSQGLEPPADLTSLLNIKGKNVFSVQYSFASPDICLGIQAALVRLWKPADLQNQIEKGRRLVKSAVIDQMRKKTAEDEADGISVGGSDISLRDPLSGMRITIPCRGQLCRHTQCFDAFSWLSMNEQIPRFQCPVCNQNIPNLKAIAVDEYFQEILQQTSPDTDSVTIEPDATWHLPGINKSSGNADDIPQSGQRDQNTSKDEPSDSQPQYDVVELDDSDDDGGATSNPATAVPAHLSVQPKLELPSPTGAMGQVSAPAGSVNGSANGAFSSISSPGRTASPAIRRPPPVTIDLTEDSSDDDEPPVRPSKRTRIDAPETASPPPSHAHVNGTTTSTNDSVPAPIQSLTNGHTTDTPITPNHHTHPPFHGPDYGTFPPTSAHRLPAPLAPSGGVGGVSGLDEYGVPLSEGGVEIDRPIARPSVVEDRSPRLMQNTCYSNDFTSNSPFDNDDHDDPQINSEMDNPYEWPPAEEEEEDDEAEEQGAGSEDEYVDDGD